MTHIFKRYLLKIKLFNRAPIALLLFMIAIGVIGYDLMIRKGLSHREFAKTNTKKELGEDGQFAGFWTSCENIVAPNKLKWFRCARDNREVPTLAIIGDSKAAALAAGLFRTSLPGKRWLMLSSRGGGDFVLMPVISNSSAYAKYESEAIYAALDALRENDQIKTVVIAVSVRHLFQLATDDSIKDLNNSPYQKDAEQGLSNFIDQLMLQKKKIIFLVDNPTLPHPEDCISRKTSISFLNAMIRVSRTQSCAIDYENYLAQSKNYRVMIDNLKSRYGNTFVVFDVAPYLCHTNPGGLCAMTLNGRPLYGNTDHISDYAAGIIGSALNEFIEKLN